MTERPADRPRLVVVSAVHPFPGESGQQQRVRHKLIAFREHFHTTFLTVAPAQRVGEVTEGLQALCDEAIVLPSLYAGSGLHRLLYLGASAVYAASTGLKRSNYVVGCLELAPARVAAAIGGRRFDLAVFEYWHAAAAAPVLRAAGARCVLDMHDVLWRSYDRQLQAHRWLPAQLRRLAVARYRAREERAWRRFDVLITINLEEHHCVAEVLGGGAELIHTPMGVDLERWPYCWSPVTPPRVAYYGGLGSRHNQRDAMLCFEEIMPEVWKAFPEAELWIVGSNPPSAILELPRRDPRVHVTGWVEEPAPLLGTMSVVVCPWTGTYGFRSRIVEVMAVGVPVVASGDCVAGMNVVDGRDILVVGGEQNIAGRVSEVLRAGVDSGALSRQGRLTAEGMFSLQGTYGALASGLASCARRNS